MPISFCGPAIFYATIAFVPLYMQFNFNSSITNGFLVHLVFTILWIIMLYFLCKFNLNNIGWVLVALPYVIGYFILRIFIAEAIYIPNFITQFTPNPKASFLHP